jgi:hypothetical protein
MTKGGHWTQYLAARLGGYEPAPERGGLGKLMMSSADWVDFDEFYLAVLQNGTLVEQSGSAPHVLEGTEDSIAFVEDWVCTGLPDGKILAPGVVTHSTPLVEHPQLVADRIQRFARVVGRENVIASTDCGLGLRCHPQVAWAKLQSLTDGAALATAALWG